MKRNILIVIIVAVILSLTSQAVFAFFYSGPWQQTDGDVNLYVDDESSFADVYIDDYDSSNSLLVMSTGDDSTVIYFEEKSGNWYASLTEHGEELSLGDKPWFTFRFNNITGYEVTEIFENKLYTIIVDIGGGQQEKYLNIDAMPIPIPGSVLLLGTGVLGLALLGFRRKKKV